MTQFNYKQCDDMKEVLYNIERCEGTHVQQVFFSTYHKALTQVCFGCKMIRSTIELSD